MKKKKMMMKMKMKLKKKKKMMMMMMMIMKKKKMMMMMMKMMMMKTKIKIKIKIKIKTNLIKMKKKIKIKKMLMMKMNGGEEEDLEAAEKKARRQNSSHELMRYFEVAVLLPLHVPVQRCGEGARADAGPGLLLAELLQELSCHELSLLVLLGSGSGHHRHVLCEFMEERGGDGGGRGEEAGAMAVPAEEEAMVVMVEHVAEVGVVAMAGRSSEGAGEEASFGGLGEAEADGARKRHRRGRRRRRRRRGGGKQPRSRRSSSRRR
jgi:hypothetical protein